MKIESIKKYDSVKSWAVGIHVFSVKYGTLVALMGTAWHFGFNSSQTAFGFCFGPITIGGAHNS